jgi:hypothetical protein
MGQEVPAPAGDHAPLWLEVIDPGGEVRDLAVGLPASRPWPLRLAPREVLAVPVLLAGTEAAPGVYRCRAMYRPEGRGPILSPPLEVEVR